MNSDLHNWDRAADGWNKEIAQPDTYRTLLISDALSKILPISTGMTVLDAGCGNGYFSFWLSQQGAIVKGIDGSAKMVEHAKNTYPQLKFEVMDLLNEISEPDHNYDAIVANMLLMHMSDIAVFLSESKRILKPNGQLVFSILHPCFNLPTTKLYKTWYQKLLGVAPNGLAHDYYIQSNKRFEAHFKTNLSHYHRTLEEYSEALQKAGFAITRVVEPHTLPESFLKQNPKLEYATRLPRFIFFNCKPI